MKKTPDLTSALARGAADARDILSHTSDMLDLEWQRLMRSIESSELVPEPVKQQLTQAVNRLGAVVDSGRNNDMARELAEAAADVRAFVTSLTSAVIRSAAQAGIPVPGAPTSTAASGSAAAGPVAEDPASGDTEQPVGAGDDDATGAGVGDDVPGAEPAVAAGVARTVAGARKAVATKSAGTKKAVAKKTAGTRKAVAKKAVAKKAVVKKAAVKKAAVGKAAVKKAGVKKAATGEPVARPTGARKSTGTAPTP